jgi:hypothetical protein
MKRYDMIEEQAMDRLLQTLPPTATGMLPYSTFRNTPEWALLSKNHSDGSIQQTLSKRWNGRLIKIDEKKRDEGKVQPTLNHAYNFCPSCGFKLN